MKYRKSKLAGLALCLAAILPTPVLADYWTDGNNLVQRALVEGPAGYTKLIITNPHNGAAGAASALAKEGRPEDAARLMIKVGQTLIQFGAATPAGRKYSPTKGQFYGMANDRLYTALKYASQLAKSDPQGASDVVIDVCRVYMTATPPDDSLRNRYRYQAQTHLTSGNPYCALTHAKAIKDATAREAQIKKVRAQAKAWGF